MLSGAGCFESSLIRIQFPREVSCYPQPQSQPFSSPSPACRPPCSGGNCQSPARRSSAAATPAAPHPPACAAAAAGPCPSPAPAPGCRRRPELPRRPRPRATRAWHRRGRGHTGRAGPVRSPLPRPVTPPARAERRVGTVAMMASGPDPGDGWSSG